VVFAGFTLGDFVMIKGLGFALAAAVLIDVTIVRVALGPALLKVAGPWNWWPGSSPHPEMSLALAVPGSCVASLYRRPQWSRPAQHDQNLGGWKDLGGTTH
jgi:hypothetical protein